MPLFIEPGSHVTRCTVFLLIRAPSLIVAPPPEKPLTLSQTTIFDSSKLKQFADDNF